MFDARDLQNIHNKLGIYTIAVSERGKIVDFSDNIMEITGYTADILKNMSAEEIFSRDTFSDLFVKETGIIRKANISHYRGYIINKDKKNIFIQLSAFIESGESGPVSLLLFQELPSLQKEKADHGSYEENIKAHKMVKKYIAPALFQRAHAAVKNGLDYIPDEVRYLTFFFADLVSYTTFAEKRNPKEVIETLNLSIGAASSTIVHWNGSVDKIMGDSIMAIFEDPMDCIIAAIEIQKEFRIFNVLRSEQGMDSLNIRVGINSGNCISGSIGTDQFKEWTVIGDAVNTASRLEKQCKVGGILISEETLKAVESRVHTTGSAELSVKGKNEKLKAFYVDGATFISKSGEEFTISINEVLEIFNV